MTLEGHIVNGQIVPDQPVPLPEGARVRIEVVKQLPEPAPTENSGETLAEKLMKYAGKAKGLPADFSTRRIDDVEAADLRHRLAAFAEDWERPEMDVYDAL